LKPSGPTSAICESTPLASRSHKQQIRRLTIDASPVTFEERVHGYAFADSEDYQIVYRAFLSKQKARFVGAEREFRDACG
jgi:hypothetical protein